MCASYMVKRALYTYALKFLLHLIYIKFSKLSPLVYKLSALNTFSAIVNKHSVGQTGVYSKHSS